jgi:hypothetical protein
MSAADRMVVRTPAGYRSVPRRVGLGMISAGRAKLATGGHAQGGYPDPAPETYQDAHAPLAPADEPLAAVVPATPESAPTPQEHTQTPAPDLDAAAAGASPDIEALGAEIADFIQAEGPAWNAQPDDVRTVPAVELPPEPKATARRGEWAEYADSLGVEVTSAMTKREIQQAAQEAATSLANLPQPALTGGRLETPEDEPATETVADDQDPRTR